MNEQLIRLDGDGWKILATPEANKLKLSILKKSSTVTVVKDQKTEIVAKDALADLAGFSKNLKNTRQSVKEPVLSLGKKIDAIASEFGQEVDAEISRVKSLLGGYAMQVAEQQRKLQEEAEAKRREAEAAERAAEAKRVAQEEARLRAENAKSAMSEARAEAEMQKRRLEAEKLEAEEEEKRRQAHALEQRAKDTRVSGTRMAWEATVTDIRALYAARPQLVKLEVRTRELNEYLKILEESGQTVELAGITCRKVPVVSAR